jgi:type I restriction enzyme S subunit
MKGKIPLGWSQTNLGNYITIKNGFAFKSKDYVDSDVDTVPVIRISDIQNKKATTNSAAHIKSKNVVNGFEVELGDLLIAMSGATTGKTGVFSDDITAYQNQRVGNIKLVVNTLGDNNFKNHLIHSLQQEVLKKAYGAAQPNISSKEIEEFEILLPPLNEQIRIANKLDSLLAKVDTAQARLEKIPTLLKRFRQSVLAAATSGELTREWREENSAPITVDIDFGKLWDEEYKKTGRRFKATQISITDDVEVDIPPTWQLTTLGQVCDVFVGATPSRRESTYWNGNINWVSSSEVAFCRISATKEKITGDGLKNTSTNIHPAGTVMLAMIGQGKTRGQAAILDIEACHNQNTAALRTLTEYLLPEYLYFFLWCQYERTRKVGAGNNQQALNKSIVQGIVFPYPPLKEQTEIVRRVESLFALADTVEKQYLAAKQRLDRLSQSLLAKAFRGELVPQDPNDEPAAELLKRIQAERQAQPAPKQKRSKPA